MIRLAPDIYVELAEIEMWQCSTIQCRHAHVQRSQYKQRKMYIECSTAQAQRHKDRLQQKYNECELPSTGLIRL